MKKIINDIKAVKERDPAARSSLEILLLYAGVHALIFHRISHCLYRHNLLFMARFLSQFSRFLTGIEIHPGAQIGSGVFIDHGMGIVIGETTIIGNNCTIYQGVTLGGTGKDKGKRHPTLQDNVLVGCGAKVLGPFTVGSGSKIAANAVVLREVPPNSTAVGIPAKITTKCTQTLDHINMPDPVAQEICKLLDKIDNLEKRIVSMEEKNNENI